MNKNEEIVIIDSAICGDDSKETQEFYK